MFSAFRRYKAIGAVEKMLQEFLAFGTVFQKLPSSTYQDPYVFGYLSEIAMYCASLVNAELMQNKLSVEDKAFVARGAVVAIAGMSWKRYSAINHVVSQGRDEFMEGMLQAQKMIAVMRGQLGAKDDPEVAEAFREALKLEPGSAVDGSTAAVAAAILKQTHLWRYIECKRRK